jgi:hypothetical protein
MPEIDREAARAQLECMAKSRVFAQGGRMLPLLEYLVGAELDARPYRRAQRTMAIDVFGQPASSSSSGSSRSPRFAGSLRPCACI